jgi:hypothetical protein
LIKFLRFEVGHLDFFDPKEEFEDLYRDMLENITNPMMDIVTVVDGKQIITIAGCTKLRGGVGEVWLLLDKSHGNVRLVRAVKKLMVEYLVKEKGFYRLQMAIDASLPERKRWAEYLGYTNEGLMKAYDNTRTDHYLYARVF